MRTLAIDLGTKRVGLAISDDGARFANALDVLVVTSPEDARAKVILVIKAESVERIVVGLPLSMDDSTGPAARNAISWGRDLARQSGKPVIFVDERLSSFGAEQALVDRKRQGEKITRKDRKERLDAIAAADFLQAFLDGKLPPIEVDR